MRLILPLTLILLIISCSQLNQNEANNSLDSQANYWEQVGGSIGLGNNASITLNLQGNPIVAWTNDDRTKYTSDLRVKQWDGTAWQNLGGILDNNNGIAAQPSIVTDNTGNPLVAWHEGDSTSTNIYVKHWSGANWQSLGGVLDFNPSSYAGYPAIALDNNNIPFVAWHEDTGSNNIYVKRWNGQIWESLGQGSLDVNSNSLSQSPSIAIDQNDYPIVTWSETNSSGSGRDIYAKRWTGNSWEQLGGSIDSNLGTYAFTPTVGIGNDGNPIVAYLEDKIYVKRWTGITWEAIGDFGSSPKPYYPNLTMDAQGNPIVAWNPYSDFGDANNVYIKRWNGENWVFVGHNPLDNAKSQNTYASSVVSSNGHLAIVLFEGSGNLNNFYVKKFMTRVWKPLGNSLNVDPNNKAINPSISLKQDDTPVVAWQEFDGSSNNIYVKQWNGLNWSQLGTAIDKLLINDAQHPSLALDSNDVPILAWQENNNIFVRKWNGSAWINVGGVLDNVQSRKAITPALVLNAIGDNISNFPIVAFSEFDGSSHNIYVKRWNGTSWTLIGDSLDISVGNNAYEPSISLNSLGNPIISWQEFDRNASNYNIYVKQWDGSAWIQLGNDLDIDILESATSSYIDIDSLDRPFIAWIESDNLFAKYWNGTNWISLGKEIDTLVTNLTANPVIRVRNDGIPVIAWQESSANSDNVYVKRWNGSRWISITPKQEVIDSTLLSQARRPNLTLKSNNMPIVAWDEIDLTSITQKENIFVKGF